MEKPPESPSAFRLMDLPTEIRLRILAFVDIYCSRKMSFIFDHLSLTHAVDKPTGHALIDTCRQLSAETWEALLSCTTRYRIDRFSVETADEEGNKGHHGQPHQPYLFKKVRQINLAFWEKQFYGSGWDEYSGNWEAFVDFVAGNFNVSNLIIIIDTDPNRRTGMNCEHEVKELPYPYSRLMGPLRRLTGLKRLHFEWPTEYAEEPEALERRLQDIKNGLRHLD